MLSLISAVASGYIALRTIDSQVDIARRTRQGAHISRLRLFVLGGDFWDKLRALFIRDAKAQFPAVVA